MQAPKRSMLGYLVPRLSSHPENVATEALTYLLQASPTAGEAIGRLAKRLEVELPPLVYDSQVVAPEAGDRSRPDVVGFDVGGRKRLIVEAKFWAGFTSNQPHAYLRQLAGDTSLLVVLVPGTRVDIIAKELEQRSADSGIGLVSLGAGSWATALGPLMTIVSWEQLLSDLDQALRVEKEDHLAFEARELLSFCRQADFESFQPVQPEELHQPTPARIVQFTSLVGEIVTKAHHEGLVWRGRLTPGATPSRYGHYFWIRSLGGWIGVDFQRWATVQPTPFWMELYSASWKPDPAANSLLAPLKPRGLLIEEPRRPAAIALPLRPGTEKDAVIRDVLKVVAEVGGLISGGANVPHLPAKS